jgi:hypothetical protein
MNITKQGAKMVLPLKLNEIHTYSLPYLIENKNLSSWFTKPNLGIRNESYEKW